MVICKTRKWGNSIGIIIPKDEIIDKNIKEDEDIIVSISKKENPLKELFDFGKKNRISRKQFLETRKLLEPGI